MPPSLKPYYGMCMCLVNSFVNTKRKWMCFHEEKQIRESVYINKIDLVNNACFNNDDLEYIFIQNMQPCNPGRGTW